MKNIVLVLVLALSACAAEVSNETAAELAQSAAALTLPRGPFNVSPLGTFGCPGVRQVETLAELCDGAPIVSYWLETNYVQQCTIGREKRLVQYDVAQNEGIYSSVPDAGGGCVGLIQ